MDEACPACGSQNWETLFEAPSHAKKRDYPIGRCARCGLVRTLGVEHDTAAATYPEFDQRETLLVRALRFGVAQLLRERARVVESAFFGEGRDATSTTTPRLLDVGCGSGAFARLMATRGWDVTGVEPFSLGRPTEEPNLRLLRAPFEEVRDQLGPMDVITMWHVLEHIDEPKPLLESLSKLLAPNGVLVVSVPNFASWQSRFFKGGWFHLDPPRHVTHFDHATLHALFDEVRLSIFDERTFHFEYGPVGWLQSGLNRLLPRTNFLYEFIKDRGALANVPVSQTALNLGLSGALGALLAAPSVAVEALAGLGAAGSVITVAARPFKDAGT
jgi:SAM-dependent methyltransferase